MQLGDILGTHAVKVMGSCSSKKRLFQELGELAADTFGLSSEDVIEALVDREALGPTGVGSGVALPHARLDALDHVCGLFIRLERPMDFDAVDRQPVDLIFALFAPTHAGVDHLKALALVSRTLRDNSVCAKLRANADATALHMLLTDMTATQAA